MVMLLSLLTGDCARKTVIDQVILITIDTLRADHLGFHGYARETSPFLDSLASKSVVFMGAVSSSSHTAPSHASIFTSLHPVQHRVLTNGQRLDESFFTISDLFKSHGYETAAFTSVNFLRGLGQGFDLFDAPIGQQKEGWRYRAAPKTVDQAIAWLTDPQRSRKIFLWIHLYDVHETQKRYAAKEEYLKRVTANSGGSEWMKYLTENLGYPRNIHKRENILKLIDRYDAQILTVDTEIARLYEKSKSTGMFDNSLWVITSDHGEGLGNHQYLGHGERIYQEQLRVPLIFHFPDKRYDARKLTPLVRHVDVFPTLLSLLRRPSPKQLIPLEGNSLEALMRGEKDSIENASAFSQRRPPDEGWRSDWEKGEVYCFQTSGYKYIVHTDGEDEFYDLSTDPFELNNLLHPSPERTSLKNAAKSLFEKFSRQAAAAGPVDQKIDQEYVEELKSLGYL
jgi:arylsulfatase A-like enzyme